MKDYNFWVYILFDERAKATYIGVTNNLERRMYEHKMGLDDGYTKEKIFISWDIWNIINILIMR